MHCDSDAPGGGLQRGSARPVHLLCHDGPGAAVGVAARLGALDARARRRDLAPARDADARQARGDEGRRVVGGRGAAAARVRGAAAAAVAAGRAVQPRVQPRAGRDRQHALAARAQDRRLVPRAGAAVARHHQGRVHGGAQGTERARLLRRHGLAQGAAIPGAWHLARAHAHPLAAQLAPPDPRRGDAVAEDLGLGAREPGARARLHPRLHPPRPLRRDRGDALARRAQAPRAARVRGARRRRDLREHRARAAPLDHAPRGARLPDVSDARQVDQAHLQRRGRPDHAPRVPEGGARAAHAPQELGREV
mmetsp:Transcript_63195/g.131450  ORF Transcript_63195/g.131450 Transcript_63195/m.131450 type:complete len:308 (-) Transcript_63195:285-1208(-)